MIDIEYLANSVVKLTFPGGRSLLVAPYSLVPHYVEVIVVDTGERYRFYENGQVIKQ